ncbi:MAG: hypothetical protein R3A48_23760 [Polyangiales bacterium]
MPAQHERPAPQSRSVAHEVAPASTVEPQAPREVVGRSGRQDW